MSLKAIPASSTGRAPGGRRLLWALLAALPLLGGCVGGAPPGPSVTLPPDAVEGAGDPTRAAIINTAYAFANPASLTGRPEEAARAVANYEFLAVHLPSSPRWVGLSPLVGMELQRGRGEVRQAVGIAPDAPPQMVVNALFIALRALQAGDAEAARRALQPPLFAGGGDATLARLANLPRLPQASSAASMALNEMNRQDQQGIGRRNFWP